MSHCSYWFKEDEVCKKKVKPSFWKSHASSIWSLLFYLHKLFCAAQLLYNGWTLRCVRRHPRTNTSNRRSMLLSFVKRLLCLGILATSICSGWKQKERGREEQGTYIDYTLHVNKVSAVIFNAYTSILCLICQQIRFTHSGIELITRYISRVFESKLVVKL